MRGLLLSIRNFINDPHHAGIEEGLGIFFALLGLVALVPWWEIRLACSIVFMAFVVMIVLLVDMQARLCVTDTLAKKMVGISIKDEDGALPPPAVEVPEAKFSAPPSRVLH